MLNTKNWVKIMFIGFVLGAITLLSCVGSTPNPLEGTWVSDNGVTLTFRGDTAIRNRTTLKCTIIQNHIIFENEDNQISSGNFSLFDDTLLIVYSNGIWESYTRRR